METRDKRRLVLKFMFAFMVFTFLAPWSVIDNAPRPDGETLSSRPVWGPHPFYKDPPPYHSKEILWVWAGIQAVVILIVGGGILALVSRRGATSTDTPET